jgi:hypothetical protein
MRFIIDYAILRSTFKCIVQQEKKLKIKKFLKLKEPFRSDDSTKKKAKSNIYFGIIYMKKNFQKFNESWFIF